MKKIFTLLIALLLTIPSFASAQLNTTQGGTGLQTYSSGDLIYSGSLNPIRFSKLNIGSNGTCLTSNGSIPVWGPCSSGGVGSGTISTSTNPTIGQLALWTTANTIGSIATSSLNLTISSFVSPNISQWTNNAGYLTAAVTSLNGLTAASQTFATTSSNGGWGFTSSGSTHTLNIPTASASNVLGLLSNIDWSTFNNKQAAGNYITVLTGDVTASGPGSVVATLKNTGPGAGSFTNANITLDAQGRVTAASNGSAGGASYPFPLAINATSTLTQFNGGLTAYASTTIGNSLSGGGLTVAGQATSTTSHVGLGVGTLVGTNIQDVNNENGAAGTAVHNSTSGNETAMFAGASGDSSVGATSNNAFYLLSNNTKLAALLPSGNLGIGTLLPNFKLEVNGTASSTKFFTSALSVGSSTPQAPVVFAQTGGLLNPDLIIDGVQNGVGAEMELNRSNNSGTEANIDFNTNGVEEWQAGIQDNNTDNFEIWDGNDDPYFTINKATGDLGIGTSSPFSELTVWGDSTGADKSVEVTDSASTTVFSIRNNGLTTATNFLATASTTLQNFTAINSTTTNATTTTLGITGLKTAAGAFLAVDGNGSVIATTTPSGSGAVSSVTATNATLTISPTIGAVLAGINLGNNNIWTAASTTFVGGLTDLTSTTTNATTTNLFVSNNASTTNLFANTGTIGNLTVGSCTGCGGTSVTGSTGQGVFMSGTNTLGATSTLFISNNSWVGIGTTTPIAPLTIATTTFVKATWPIGLLIGSTPLTNSPSTNGTILGISYPSLTFTGDVISVQSTFPGASQAFAVDSSGGMVVGNIKQIQGVGATINAGGYQVAGQNGTVTFGNNSGAAGFSNAGILAGSGNNQTIGNSQIGFFIGGGATVAGAADQVAYFEGSGFSGIGTTTSHWVLDLATSSKPQLTLTDPSSGGTHWSFRNAGGNLFFATSSPTTFATSTTGFYGLEIDSAGHLSTNTGKPTLSSCGGSPSVTGDDNSGTITVGTTATACTLTFAVARAAAPHCVISNQSMSVTNAMTYTESTANLVVTQAVGLSGDLIDYQCSGH